MNYKKWWGGRKTISFGDIVNHLNSDGGISKGYIEKTICEAIKTGLLVFDRKDKSESFTRVFYMVNESEIIKTLEQDEIFKMDTEIVRGHFSIMVK